MRKLRPREKMCLAQSLRVKIDPRTQRGEARGEEGTGREEEKRRACPLVARSGNVLPLHPALLMETGCRSGQHLLCASWGAGNKRKRKMPLFMKVHG